MRYNRLGETGLFISQLCFGASNFGGADHPVYSRLGGIDQAGADRIVGTVIDAGINFIDTADIYANGEAEEMLGLALKGRRDKVLISTKVNNRMGPGPNEVGQSRVHLMRSIEGSLRRLNTDVIDIYYIHLFDPLTRFEDCLRSFDDMIRQGKVRYIGCSNLAAWQMMKTLKVSAMNGLEPFVSAQAYYSLAGRDIEREIAPFVTDQKLGLITWGGLAGGLLTGKYGRDRSPQEASRRTSFNFPPVDLDHAWRVIDAAMPVAERHGASLAQIAMAWQLTKPFVASALFGARNVRQIEDTLKAMDIVLSEGDLAILDGVSALRTEYPQWQFDLSLGREPGGTRDWSKMLS